MSQFSGRGQLSESSSDPQVIPGRPTSSLNDVLSFSSWNDDIISLKKNETFSSGQFVPISKSSDPVPIVRSRPTSTSSFDLPEFSATPVNSTSNGRSSRTDSMADWSIPNFPKSQRNGDPPSDTPDNEQCSCAPESLHDEPQSLTESWVSLPPGNMKSKSKTRNLQNDVIDERDSERGASRFERDGHLNRPRANGFSHSDNETDAPILVPTNEERVLALNSWTDVNEEPLPKPKSRRSGEFSPTKKRQDKNYPWSEFVNVERPQPRHEKTKFKDKWLTRLSLKKDPSPSRERRHSDQNSGLTRVSLDKGSGPGRLYVAPNQNGLYPSLATHNVDPSETIRTKLQSAWNNVKYGWTMKAPTHFSDEKPLFLLGRCYHSKIDESMSHELPIRSIDKFRQDFGSRIWFTYRREFSPLEGSNLTTDCGWGCMLRSGQMMLAQAFVLHFLGRGWHWYCSQSAQVERHHRQIIRWFLDTPSNQSPFSIHHLVKLGSKSMGKKVGDWYGPASIAQILGQAMETAPELNPSLEDICVYVAHDCTLYLEDIKELCTKRYRANSDLLEAGAATWRSVVILVPVRLGGETLNSIYVPCLKNMLSQDFCLGIIGGKPKHSLYFVGWQDDKLVYLDPHYCQDSVVTNNKDFRDFPLHTYHCISPRKLAFSKMDPSCTIGFYCRTREDFEQFIAFTKEAVSPPLQKSPYPMFIVSDGKSTDVKDHPFSSLEGLETQVLEYHDTSLFDSVLLEDSPPPRRSKSKSRTSEDYVFL